MEENISSIIEADGKVLTPEDFNGALPVNAASLKSEANNEEFDDYTVVAVEHEQKSEPAEPELRPSQYPNPDDDDYTPPWADEEPPTKEQTKIF